MYRILNSIFSQSINTSVQNEAEPLLKRCQINANVSNKCLLILKLANWHSFLNVNCKHILKIANRGDFCVCYFKNFSYITNFSHKKVLWPYLSKESACPIYTFF